VHGLRRRGGGGGGGGGGGVGDARRDGATTATTATATRRRTPRHIATRRLPSARAARTAKYPPATSAARPNAERHSADARAASRSTATTTASCASSSRISLGAPDCGCVDGRADALRRAVDIARRGVRRARVRTRRDRLAREGGTRRARARRRTREKMVLLSSRTVRDRLTKVFHPPLAFNI
jgi:hypothetical protein